MNLKLYVEVWNLFCFYYIVPKTLWDGMNYIYTWFLENIKGLQSFKVDGKLNNSIRQVYNAHHRIQLYDAQERNTKVIMTQMINFTFFSNNYSSFLPFKNNKNLLIKLTYIQQFNICSHQRLKIYQNYIKEQDQAY